MPLLPIKIMKKEENITNETALQELIQAILLLENKSQATRFFKDLCTPQELQAMAERWRVCKMLQSQTLSYRDIHEQTGASLTTITRVARFLKIEPHQGYTTILKKLQQKLDK